MEKPGPCSITTYLPSGSPDGIRWITKANWIGNGFVFPRTQLKGLETYSAELEKPGIYLLWAVQESALPIVYVGRSTKVLSRMRTHERLKPFWSHAAIFAAIDQSLNDAHLAYIEAELIMLVKKAKRSEPENIAIPTHPKLRHAEEGFAKDFLADLLLCLRVAGVDFFSVVAPTQSDAKVYFLKNRHISASGENRDEGFVILAGSQARKELKRQPRSYILAARERLLKAGILVDAGHVYQVTENSKFNSSSTAAEVLLGRPASGPEEWKDKDGRPLKDDLTG